MIDTVVALILENRSFDHLLGYFPDGGAGGGEVDGHQINI